MIKKTIQLFTVLLVWNAAADAAGQSPNKTSLRQEYVSAYKNWRKLPLDIDANLRFANAALVNGYADSALAAYDRVLILDEQNFEAQIQIVNIHITENRNELALMTLNDIDPQQLNAAQLKQVASLRNRLQQQLAADNTEPSKRAITASLSAGLLYDSNIYGDIGEQSFVLPAYNLNYQGNSTTGKMAAFEALHVDGDVPITSRLSFNAGLDLYNKNYFANDKDNKDLSSIRGQIMPRYLIGTIEIDTPLAINGVFIANKNYANIYSAGINLLKNFSNSQFGATYKFEAYKFAEDNADKNSNKHNFGAHAAYMPNAKTLLFGKLNFGKNTEREDKRTDVNYQQSAVLLGLNYKITKKLTAKTALGFDVYKYSDDDKLFLNTRQDKLLSLDLGLDFAITNNSKIAADLNYQDSRSNQFIYQYDKTVLSMNYNYSF